jgi:histidinol-phosphate aminotransferase
VLTQAPNYEQLGFYAAMLGIRLTEIPYRRKRGFVLDDFVAALDVPSTSIWISNPNGPSGWRMPSAEVASLAADCHRRGHALIIDEAYADFADCSHLDLVARYPNAVVIRSFSKGWAMAGARLAYLAASPELVSYLRAWNPENPISGSTLELARALREREPEFVRARRELNAARDWFADAAARQIPGAEALPSEANFVNIDVGSEAFAAHLSNALHAHGILVRVMTEATRLGGCLRVTAAEHDVLASVLDIACDAAQSFRSDFDERDRHGVR